MYFPLKNPILVFLDRVDDRCVLAGLDLLDLLLDLLLLDLHLGHFRPEQGIGQVLEGEQHQLDIIIFDLVDDGRIHIIGLQKRTLEDETPEMGEIRRGHEKHRLASTCRRAWRRAVSCPIWTAILRPAISPWSRAV